MVNNRYLMYAATTLDIEGVIQVTYHMPAVPFTGAYFTSTVLTVDDNPVLVSNPFTLTAVVSSLAIGMFDPGVPVGTVQFYDGNTPIGSPAALDYSGTARLTTSSLTPGTHFITALFIPADNQLASSTSPTLDEIIFILSTMTALSVEPLTTTEGENVVLTATVTAPGSPPPRRQARYSSTTGRRPSSPR